MSEVCENRHQQCRYKPLPTRMIKEFQFTVYNGSMPYPLWSWIQSEDMDSPLGMRHSVNLAKIIYQGEQNIFADIDDARLQRVVNEKVFHPSFNLQDDSVILSS